MERRPACVSPQDENPVAPTAASVTAGAATFKKYCSFCHSAAAKGNGPHAERDYDASGPHR
jgi:mono/diheme cytochrome c family protein